MNGRLHVVVDVPENGDRGNLATGIGGLYLDPQAYGGDVLDPPVPLHDTEIGILTMYIQVPVFRRGEILVLGSNDRDQFGRKPSKWDVRLEEFDDPEDAIRRAREVSGL